MDGLSGQVWVVLAIVAGVGVLSVLHILAASLRNAAYVHEMRVRVSTLRKDQAERLQALADASEAADNESRKIASQVGQRAA